MGNFPLLGLDRTAWEPNNEADLIAIYARSAPDLFSKWFTYTFIPYFHKILGRRVKRPLPEDPESEITQYEESNLTTTVSIISIVVASLFPLASIIVLFFVDSPSTRLGIIVGFAALFSLSLALLTNARKIEIFAATAAFAAVQVVFITNGTGCIA